MLSSVWNVDFIHMDTNQSHEFASNKFVNLITVGHEVQE